MFNFGFIGLALSLMPEFFVLIGETIEAVDAQFGPGNGEQKKQEVIEAATSAYKLLDKGFNLPESVDNAVIETIPHLVELLFRGMKDGPQEATNDTGN
jgi:hypothetical protein